MANPYVCSCTKYIDSLFRELDKRVYDKKSTDTNLYNIIDTFNRELCEAYADMIYAKNDIYLSRTVVSEAVVHGEQNGIDCFANWSVVEIIAVGDTPGASDYAQYTDWIIHPRGIQWGDLPQYYGSYAVPYGYGYTSFAQFYNAFAPTGQKEPVTGDIYYVTYKYGCRNENLYNNFGVLVKLKKLSYQTYPEYRDAIRTLILAYIGGPTVANIRSALSVFHDENSIQIEEFTNRTWVLGENILYDEDTWSNGSSVNDGYRSIEIPNIIKNTPYIKTHIADNQNSDTSFLTFNVDTNIIIYLAFDNMSSIPSWLSSWEELSFTLTTTHSTRDLILYSKKYNTGQITLNGNSSSENSLMYIPFFKSVITETIVEQTTIVISNISATSGETYSLADLPEVSDAVYTGGIICSKTNYSSGTDIKLTSPDDSYNTDDNFTPYYNLDYDTTTIYLGDYSWTHDISEDPFTDTGSYNANSSGTTYGAARMVFDGLIAQSSSDNGIKTFYFPKSVNGDHLGGYIQFFYNQTAWTANDAVDVYFTIDGSVFKDSVSDNNLVITGEGVAGPSGGGSTPTCTFSSIPSILDNCQIIKTHSDDRDKTDTEFLSFTISYATTVYVAFDADAESIPDWLSSWTDTGETLTVSYGSTEMTLYSKEYSAGTVTLGANRATGNNESYIMYLVFVDVNLTISTEVDTIGTNINITNITSSSGKSYQVDTDGIESGDLLYADDLSSSIVDISDGIILREDVGSIFEWSVTFYDSDSLDTDTRNTIETLLENIKPAHTIVYVYYS